jgi:hypothetical protein
MKTPAGKECPQYYADFHRERRVQECRLAKRNPASEAWRAGDCFRCAVPDIVRANASPHLRLKITVRQWILGINRHVVVEAYCEKHNIPVEDPFVGCVRCNADKPGVNAFIEAIESLPE